MGMKWCCFPEDLCPIWEGQGDMGMVDSELKTP